MNIKHVFTHFALSMKVRLKYILAAKQYVPNTWYNSKCILKVNFERLYFW